MLGEGSGGSAPAGSPNGNAKRPAPFLERLAERDHRRLLEAAERRRWEAGTVVQRQDALADVALVVVGGCVLESHATAEGHELILDLHGPGDVVGLCLAIAGQPALTTARAVTPTELLAVRGPDFRSLLTSAPSLYDAALQALAERLQQVERARIQMAVTGVLSRLSRCLLELTERWGRPRRDRVDITLRLSQTELASWACASREATVKALRTLREEGVVDTGRRRITVTDLEGLRAHADE